MRALSFPSPCPILASSLRCRPRPKADDKFQPGDIVAGNLIVVRPIRKTEDEREREGGGRREAGGIALPKNPPECQSSPARRGGRNFLGASSPLPLSLSPSLPFSHSSILSLPSSVSSIYSHRRHRPFFCMACVSSTTIFLPLLLLSD